MRQRVQSKSLPESASKHAADLDFGLSADRVDRLLVEEFPESEESRGTAPIDGIWLGAAAGMVLWGVIVALVLLAWPS